MRKFSKALSLNIYILTYNYIIFRERELFSIFRIFVFLGVQVNIIVTRWNKIQRKKNSRRGGIIELFFSRNELKTRLNNWDQKEDLIDRYESLFFSKYTIEKKKKKYFLERIEKGIFIFKCLFSFQTRLCHQWGRRRRVRRVYSRIFAFCPWRSSSISNSR